ncbi:hypothetical protein KSP40_PGU007479 [Platanthera guangdongensis]|uniref:Uncharacterized protein n=1 Tax=Platanthera guangdongensis TaxID=2320717 RepID=A0ABR2LHV5_9ASPA
MSHKKPSNFECRAVMVDGLERKQQLIISPTVSIVEITLQTSNSVITYRDLTPRSPPPAGTLKSRAGGRTNRHVAVRRGTVCRHRPILITCLSPVGPSPGPPPEKVDRFSTNLNPRVPLRFPPFICLHFNYSALANFYSKLGGGSSCSAINISVAEPVLRPAPEQETAGTDTVAHAPGTPSLFPQAHAPCSLPDAFTAPPSDCQHLSIIQPKKWWRSGLINRRCALRAFFFQRVLKGERQP